MARARCKCIIHSNAKFWKTTRLGTRILKATDVAKLAVNIHSKHTSCTYVRPSTYGGHLVNLTYLRKGRSNAVVQILSVACFHSVRELLGD